MSIQELAAEAAGNWRDFESFSWHDQPDDGENWCIVYTHNRDSGLVEQSNADAIKGIMEQYIEDGTVVPEHHGHWACGWVDGFAIRVYAPDGSITPAFRRWCEIQEWLEDYPVLDDEDYSRREYEAAHNSIKQTGQRYVRDGAPKDWVADVYDWLSENDQRQLENRDGTGACPTDEVIQEALIDLDLIDPEYDPRIPDQAIRCPVCCELVPYEDNETIGIIPPHDNLFERCHGSGRSGLVEQCK